MNPMRDDETESLEQNGIRRDTPTKSPTSAGTQQFEKEKSDSDSSNYLFVYFTQRKDKSDKVSDNSNHYSNHLKRVKLKNTVLLQF